MTKDKNVFESSKSFNYYQQVGPKGEEANNSQNHSVHSDVDESFKEL